MSRESEPPEKKVRKPQNKEITNYYKELIREVHEEKRSYIPTYREVALEFNRTPSAVVSITRRNPELIKALSDARKEAKNNVTFIPSKEMAWFLGMLTGSSGVVDSTFGFIRFTNADENLRQIFKETGETLLAKDSPHLQGYEKKKQENSNKSINFFSQRHTDALGNFTRAEKTNTLKERHPWVLDDEYIDTFISGVFDSGSSIWVSAANRQIEFMTSHADVAGFYVEMLVKIGLNPNIIINKKRGEIRSVAIHQIKDLKQFATRINTLSQEKQKKLDAIKNSETKKGNGKKVHSPGEILTEWKRLKKKLNRTPTTGDILELRAKGETPYSRSIYIKYFGVNEEGKATFARAEQFLEELATLKPSEAKKRMSHIEILKVNSNRKKYNDEELIEEWGKVVTLAGPNPTRNVLLQLYKEKKIKIHERIFINYFGRDPLTNKVSFKIARDRLNQALVEKTQDTEKQIFP